MSKQSIVAVIKLEIAARRPKSYTEALHIVGEVLSKHSVQHTDLFDPRRACSRFCKATVTAV